jgi:hypothetical protein
MRRITVIAVCIALSVICVRLAVAGEQEQGVSLAGTQPPPPPGDELHFVSVLTLRGEVVAIDSANRLVTVGDVNGHSSKLEVRSEKDLDSLTVGDRVVARYVEGAQINKKKLRGAAASLNDGMTGSDFGGTASKSQMLVATVENVDAAEQEVTIKGEDGSLETIMVANPKYLRHIKVGDHVVITGAQALALSLEKAG